MSKIFEALKRAGWEAERLEQLEAGDAQLVSTDVVAAGPPEDGLAEGPLDPADKRPAEPAIQPQRLLSQSVPVPIIEPEKRFRPERIRAPEGTPVFPFDEVQSPAGEQYRVLRSKIVHHPQQPRMLAVSSPGLGDGKTITSLNLAGALALKSDVSVLLLETEFRRSSIAGLLGIPPAPGLSEVLRGLCALDDALIRVQQFRNFFVLPAGRPNCNPSELLDSPSWKALCAMFQKYFRFTILDAPPVHAAAEFDPIQAVCDGVILVLRPGHTNRDLSLKALGAVPKDKLVGVLINFAEDWFLWRSHDHLHDPSEAL